MIARIAEAAAAVEGTDREVAGWITDRGVHIAGTFARDAFAFDDATLLALVAAERSDAPPRAIFHSHPDGRAVLSGSDRRAWAPSGVPLWPWPQLVIATRGGRAIEAALFAWRGEGPVEVAAFARDGGDVDDGERGWHVVRGEAP